MCHLSLSFALFVTFCPLQITLCLIFVFSVSGRPLKACDRTHHWRVAESGVQQVAVEVAVLHVGKDDDRRRVTFALHCLQTHTCHTTHRPSLSSGLAFHQGLGQSSLVERTQKSKLTPLAFLRSLPGRIVRDSLVYIILKNGCNNVR